MRAVVGKQGPAVFGGDGDEEENAAVSTGFQHGKAGRMAPAVECRRAAVPGGSRFRATGTPGKQPLRIAVVPGGSRFRAT